MGEAQAGGLGAQNGAGKSVLVIGALIVDSVCHVPTLPRSGEGVVAESALTALGGCAHNTACAIKELGLPVTLFAPIGQGIYADYVRIELARRGLEGFEVAQRAFPPRRWGSLDNAAHGTRAFDGRDVMAQVQSTSGRRGNPEDAPAVCDNGVCVCMVEPDGERTMLTLPGIDRRYQRAWFDGVRAEDHSCAVVSGYEIEPPEGDAIVEFLEDHPGLPVYFGPGPRICSIPREKMARINALRPVWHLNDQEALAYTGASSIDEAGHSILEQCRNAVVITEGARGSRAFTPDGEFFAATQPVEAVDTVGAGDAHIGVVAALRSAGRPWKDALSLANQVAGIVCQHEGAAVPPGALEELHPDIGCRL